MRAALLTGCLVTLSSGAAHAAAITVTTAADLATAIGAAQPGDTITIADGSYTIGAPLQCQTAATSAAPITVRAADPHQVTLLASNVNDVFLVSGAWWRFDGIDVTGAVQHAWHVVNPAAFVSIQRSLITDAGSVGVLAECGGPEIAGAKHCDGGSIVHVQVVRTTPSTACHGGGAETAGIEIVGGKQWAVAHNRLTNISVDQNQCPGLSGFGIILRGYSSSARVVANLVSGSDVGIAAGTGIASMPCELRGAIGPAPCTPPSPACEDSGSQISNNVVVNTRGAGVLAYQACSTRIENVTLWNNRSDIVAVTSVLVSGPLSVMVPVQNVLLTAAVVDQMSGSHVAAGNLLLPTPSDKANFLDAANGNFRLVAGAPALDTGVTLADVPTDYDGVTRPQGSAYDVGAFERPLAGYSDAGLPNWPDGGVSDAGGGGGGGGGLVPNGGGGSNLPPMKGSCSCQLGGAPTSAQPGAALLLVGALLLVRRRARHAA